MPSWKGRLRAAFSLFGTVWTAVTRCTAVAASGDAPHPHSASLRVSLSPLRRVEGSRRRRSQVEPLKRGCRPRRLSILDSATAGGGTGRSIPCVIVRRRGASTMYDEMIVAPMRQELTRLGVAETRTAQDVDAV